MTERLAWGLWLPTCSTETREALRDALAEVNANFDATAFGAEEMLDASPEAPVVELLNRVGGGLVAARALARVSVGGAAPVGGVAVLDSCPSAATEACEYQRLDSSREWSGATRAYAWALTEAITVTVPDDRLETVRRLLAECERAPSSAIGIVVGVPGESAQAESLNRELAANAGRLLRRLDRLTPDDETLRGRKLADGIAHADLRAPAWLQALGPRYIWVVPKLSRIAGRPLLLEVQRCLAGTGARVR